MNLRPPLFVGICITATVTLAATVYAVTKPRLAEPASQQSRQAVSTVSSPCQAQVNDPHPPLNVRSTPDDASNNVVGTVANGSAVTIVNSHRKWVQISAPISGWVYEDYVSSNCQHAAAADLEVGEQMYTLAMGRYQAGQLDTAITQLKTISTQSPAYRKAQIALKTLPAEWQQAERQYQDAALAYKAGKWNDVVVTVNNFPDIRFWREKLTPLVKQAIANQQKATTTAQSQAS
jgi:Bacterial SH3 domain